MNKKSRIELMIVLSFVVLMLTALPVLADSGGTYPAPYPAPGGAGDLAIAGITVAALTALIVQAIKEYFGVDGQSVRAIAVIVGIVLSAVALMIEQNLLSEGAVQAIKLAVLAISGGFGSSGLYRLVINKGNEK